MKRHFRSKLLAGLLAVIPVGVTAWVLYFLFHAIDGLLRPLLQPRLGRYYVTGMGLLTVMLLVYAIGVITSNFLGSRLVRLGEQLLERLPLARHIYGPAKQLMQTVVFPNDQTFKRVVLVEYPKPGVHVIGFVTGRVTCAEEAEQWYNVFVPTSPNPTSGLILVCQPASIRNTDLTVENAMKMIISAGASAPDALKLGTSDSQRIA